MKSMIVGVLVCLAVATTFGDDYREFTDMQGRVIKAKIVEFNSAKGKILIEREGGKQVWVSPEIFAEEDRAYATKWICADRVLSEKHLRISFKKVIDRVREKATAQHVGFDGDSVYFEVLLENRSKEPIKNLIIEYRYFISVDEKIGGGKQYVRPVSGEARVEQIDAESSVTVTTEPATFGERIKNIEVVVKGDGYQKSDTEEKTLSEEDLEGIWLKIMGPELEGASIVRNACFPAKLEKKLEWGETLSKRVEQAMQRGMVTSSAEMEQWGVETLREISSTADTAALHELSKAAEFTYNGKISGASPWATMIAVAFYHKGLYDLSIRWLEIDPQNITGFPGFLLVDLYASAPAVCDGEKAVRLAAGQGIELYEKSITGLSILAKAYARNGQFEKAVSCQEQALAKLEMRNASRCKDRYKDFFERRLELYRSGAPYELNPSDPCEWHYRYEYMGESFLSDKEEDTNICLVAITQIVGKQSSMGGHWF